VLMAIGSRELEVVGLREALGVGLSSGVEGGRERFELLGTAKFMDRSRSKDWNWNKGRVWRRVSSS